MAFVDQVLTSIDTSCGFMKGKSFTPSLPRNVNGVKKKVTVEVANVTHYVLRHITSRHVTSFVNILLGSCTGHKSIAAEFVSLKCL